jgi:hypothetical protein
MAMTDSNAPGGPDGGSTRAGFLRTRGAKVAAGVTAGFLAAVGGYIGNRLLSVAERPFADAPLTVRVLPEGTFESGHVWAPYYVVPNDVMRGPSALSTSQREAAANGRRPSADAIAGSDQVVRLEIRGATDTPVLIHEIRANVVRRSPPVRGWFVASPGCGAAPVRIAAIDLDRGPSRAVYYDEEGRESKDLVLRVDKSDVEVVEIHASTSKSSVEWTIEVFYSTDEGTGSLSVTDGDRSFRVTTERASKGYRPAEFDAEGAPGSFVREPSWDDGISAC